MIRAFAFFLILSGLVLLAAWFAEHPGTVRVTFGDWRLHTSVGFLVVLALVGVFAAVFLDRLWRYLVTSPRRIAVAFRENRRRRGYQALTQGLVAVAAEDGDEAGRLARRAEGLLHNPPLTMLLSAQAAQLQGDEGAAANYFESMLHHPEMAFLGIRGLFMQALRDGDEANALRLAKRAYALHPKTPWVVQALFERELRAGKLEDAEATLREAVRQRVLPAAEGKRRRAVLLLRQSALSKADGQAAAARRFAQDAWKLVPGFGPAAICYARHMAEAGDVPRAEKAIEKAWKESPHPDLAAAYLEIAAPKDALGRLQKIENLARLSPRHPESHLAVAEAALKAKIWGQARSHLADAIATLPSARAFRQMAELEAGEGGGEAAIAQWQARAAAAPADHLWICGHCGAIAAAWAPVCANCDTFDGFQWRSPGPGGPGAKAPPQPPISGRTHWFSRESSEIPNR